MVNPSKMDELSSAENPARALLEKLGWAYTRRELLAAERDDEREVLLKGRLRAALLRLNEWMTEAQADWAIGELEHTEGSGIARNQRVHEDLIYGKPVSTSTAGGRQSRIARFFDFEHPEGGLNEFVVTTQFRVRRGNERQKLEDDQRVVKPDLVLFVNGIPLVVMEAKSPSLMNVWKSKAVRQFASLPGGGSGVARDRRAGAISHEPAVRGAQRGGGGLRDAGGTGERLRGVEVGTALFGNRSGAALWSRAEGAGTANRGAAGSGDAAGHPAGLRGVRAAGREAGEEAAALPAVPSGGSGAGASAEGPQARRKTFA